MITESERQQFQEAVWTYYNEHGRHDLPWRSVEVTSNFSPYAIMVSELMLQQTQVARVIPKYLAFLERFPDIQTLAAAPLADVLVLWSGLGYNRRAKFLHQAAAMVVSEFGGVFPVVITDLVRLPGVGNNTAGAIAAYAYNAPAVFIETNVRTVYIHHFFNDQTDVTDKQLQAAIAETHDQEHSREWYWAIMDYGSFLKQSVGNLNKLSVTYAKQSTFAGSRRQVRGAVIRLLGQGELPLEALQAEINDERLAAVLADLVLEGMIQRTTAGYRL